MHSRYARGLAALATAALIALPAVAQARGGSDDPAGHHQREHQVRQDRHHDRIDNDHLNGGRHDDRGTDDGPNHT